MDVGRKRKVTIISHLRPEDWKLSWNDKVIVDNEGSMAAHQPYSGYWGHFKSDDEFVISYHKEYEIKGMSLSQYFNGRIEPDEQGCKITGTFGKKWSANLFLTIGAVLCLVAFIAAVARMDLTICLTAGFLFIIILGIYLFQPEQGKKQIMTGLEQISFDSAFYGKGIATRASKKKKKRSMKEKASVKVDNECSK